MEKLFSCEEIAERYAVKITTVWAWIRGGELPAIKVGKQYRIRADDLEAFEQKSNTVPASTK
ncbi:MAG: helix-turn-helix domain-containing protein [Clostridia bacterium]|nr:helix-turn-helix domain-containing protein [Clostridia bacterium]